MTDRREHIPYAESGDGNTSEHLVFQPVTRAPRLSDKVADMVLERILAQGFKPGDRLPSERELGEQFGVSRTVVREATRALAARGIIDVRAGVGLCVAAVDASAVSSSMRLYLHGTEELTYEKVHEVRSVIEIHAAGLAAERATAEDLTEMKVSMDALAACVHDPDEFTAADVEFHRVICKLTHNPLYVMVLDSIGEVLLEIRRATVYIPKRLPELLKVHRQIYDAIALHDVEGAQAAMRDHLEELDRAWRKLSRPVGRLVKK